MRIKVFTPLGMKVRHVDERGWTELDEGATLRDLIRRIGIPLPVAKALLVSLNGQKKPLDTPLKNGDVVGFFSLIAGG